MGDAKRRASIIEEQKASGGREPGESRAEAERRRAKGAIDGMSYKVVRDAADERFDIITIRVANSRMADPKAQLPAEVAGVGERARWLFIKFLFETGAAVAVHFQVPGQWLDICERLAGIAQSKLVEGVAGVERDDIDARLRLAAAEGKARGQG